MLCKRYFEDTSTELISVFIFEKTALDWILFFMFTKI